MKQGNVIKVRAVSRRKKTLLFHSDVGIFVPSSCLAFLIYFSILYITHFGLCCKQERLQIEPVVVGKKSSFSKWFICRA